MNMKILLTTILACLLCPAMALAGPGYTLDQILDSARHKNIAISDAQHGIDKARLLREEAHSKYFPSISATGMGFAANKGMAKMEVNPAEVIPAEIAASLAQTLPGEALAALSSPISISMMKNGILAGVTALQPVYSGGQIVNANRLARVGEDVSRLQLELSENEVERTAEQYFWQLVSLQEKVKTIDAVQALLADLNKDATVAVLAGVALRNDLLQVQLRQNEVESHRLKLNNGISVVKLLLAHYCGLNDTTFTLNYDVKTTVPPLALRRDHHDAMAATPEYRLLGKQVEALPCRRRWPVDSCCPR